MKVHRAALDDILALRIIGTQTPAMRESFQVYAERLARRAAVAGVTLFSVDAA